MATQLLRLRGAADDTTAMGGPWTSGVYLRGGRRPRPAAGAQPASSQPASAPAVSRSGLPAWAGPEASSITRGQYSSLELPHDVYGAGLANYGVNDRNVWNWLDRNRTQANVDAGGGRQLWENLGRWSTRPNSQVVNADQRTAWDRYVSTGDRSGVSTDTALRAYDWSLREISRHGKRRHEGFFDSVLGQVLSIGAQVAVGFIPTVGPALSAGIGAATGAATGGLRGALIGGLSGYGIGRGAQWVRAGGLTSLTAPANGAGVTATGGNAIANVGNNLLAGAVRAGSNLTLGGVATGVNAAIGVRDLIAGAGGAAAAGYVLANGTPALPASPSTPPPATKTPAEIEQERFARRRRAVDTNLTWGSTLAEPSIARPGLLGGRTRLAA